MAVRIRAACVTRGSQLLTVPVALNTVESFCHGVKGQAWQRRWPAPSGVRSDDGARVSADCPWAGHQGTQRSMAVRPIGAAHGPTTPAAECLHGLYGRHRRAAPAMGLQVIVNVITKEFHLKRCKGAS